MEGAASFVFVVNVSNLVARSDELLGYFNRVV